MPAELRRVDRWVCHTGRKIPVTPDGRPASSTDPTTWTSYRKAKSGRHAGIGFVLAGDGISVIDLDHCIEGTAIASWATRILHAAGNTYIEVSPSGQGLHIWGYADVGAGTRRNGVEVYGDRRYITVTGQPITGPARLGDITVAASIACNG